VSIEINYGDVLNDLRAKQAAIEEAIRGISSLMNLGTIPSGVNTVTSAPDTNNEIAGDAFFGLSIVEATKKFLSAVKRPKTTEEIMAALDTGGYVHTSKKFYSTVYGVLRREHVNDGGIVKLKDSWGLAEWYPNRRRDRSARKAEIEIFPDEKGVDKHGTAITEAA
jgi:hypothetical protein